jgi:hypothetical protein
MQVVYYASWDVDDQGQPVAEVTNRSSVPGLSLQPGMTYVEQSRCPEGCRGRGRCAVWTSEEKNTTTEPRCK